MTAKWYLEVKVWRGDRWTHWASCDSDSEAYRMARRSAKQWYVVRERYRGKTVRQWGPNDNK